MERSLPDPDDKITNESITSPHHTERVSRAKYMAMRVALMTVLPADPPGITVAAAKAALLPILPIDQLPGGDETGWWLKVVQLDLEAKCVIRRGLGKPVRPFRSSHQG
jgi:hypothetical protein